MRPDGIILRSAEPADVREIARLCGELGYPTAVDDMRSRLDRLLEEPDHHVVVAEGSQGVLGWIHVEHRRTVESPARAEVVGLVVDPAVRRSGLGARLVSAAEQWAKRHGLTEITVRSNVLRTLSHPFYEKVGYSRVKTQHAYIKALPSGGRP